ncbi:MAG: CPBP family intramembrane glutamic endopeptidase [bacterium]|jgi:membrane protease YdiL (CAAX protease family)
MDNFPSIADHIFIWAFGIIIPFLSGVQSQKISDSITFDSRARISLYLTNSLMLSIAGSAILVLWLATDRPFEHLGFRTIHWQHQQVIIIATILFILLYVADTLNTKKAIRQKGSSPEWIKKYSFLPQRRKELTSYILLCLCAGIFEEIIYRGFMVTYFMPADQEGFPLIALLAPAFLFGLAHYYQGWAAVIKIGIFSILFGIIFIYSKSLYPTIVIHFLVDVLSGVFYMNQLNKLEQ